MPVSATWSVWTVCTRTPACRVSLGRPVEEFATSTEQFPWLASRGPPATKYYTSHPSWPRDNRLLRIHMKMDVELVSLDLFVCCLGSLLISVKDLHKMWWVKLQAIKYFTVQFSVKFSFFIGLYRTYVRVSCVFQIYLQCTSSIAGNVLIAQLVHQNTKES